MGDSYSYDGPPMGQPSVASTRSNGPPLGKPSAATSDQSIIGIVVPAHVASIIPLPTTLMAVSPATPTVDGTLTPATSSEASTATVEDVMPPSWKMVGGVIMTPPDWKMACVVAKEPDECSLSSEEDDEDSLPADVDFDETLRWLRSEEKASADRHKRKAEERAEENKKRRAIEGYRPAFIIDIAGVPLEQVESERRSAVAAAAAVVVAAAATEQREESKAHLDGEDDDLS
jgi:hypothetical protein